MAKKRLTDPSIPAIITLDLADLIHVVDVSDTTSHPTGSSKKASIQQIKNLIASFNDQFIELSDTPANYTGSSLKFVRVNSGETGLEFASIDLTFLGLSDTPSSYSGQSLKTIRVNAGETGLEFYTIDLSGYEQTANKGVANGYVPLNGSTKIDSIYLPSYVDDVLEYANLAAFPLTGETGKIYTAIDTNKIYRWSGSVYIEISASTIPTWAAVLFQNNATNGTNPLISTADAIEWWNTNTTFKTYLSNDQATTGTITVYLPKIAGELAVHAFGVPLTQNYMVKGGANGILSSSTLVYDNGTNVGIGTATPSAKLHVKSSSGTAFRVDGSTTNNNFVVADSGFAAFGASIQSDAKYYFQNNSSTTLTALKVYHNPGLGGQTAIEFASAAAILRFTTDNNSWRFGTSNDYGLALMQNNNNFLSCSTSTGNQFIRLGLVNQPNATISAKVKVIGHNSDVLNLWSPNTGSPNLIFSRSDGSGTEQPAAKITGTGGGSGVSSYGQIELYGYDASTFNKGLTIYRNGAINMNALPTSSAGLSAGDLWNNGGVVNIV